MSSATSVQVANRIATAQSVIKAARIHAELVAAAVTRACEQFASAPLPDPKAFVLNLADVLEAATARMTDRDQALGLEVADDFAVRDEREEATAETAKAISGVRRLVEDYAGRRAAESFGFVGPTPRVTQDVTRVARHAVNTMRQANLAIVIPEVGETTSGRLATRIEKALQRLDAAVDALTGEAREYEAALTDRDRAVEDWVRVYQGTAAIIVGLLRFAGREDLAERVRPTERRSQGIEAAPPVEAEAPTETPAEPAPAE